MRRFTNRNSWFLRLLTPYFLFMLLAILLGSLIYDRTLELVDAEGKKNNLHLLQQVKVTLDGRLAEIDAIMMQAAGDPKILGLQQLKEPFEGTNTYKVLATKSDLYNFSASNNFILNYLIYYRNSDLVIGPSLLYESEKFYRNALNYSGMGYTEWHKLFFEDSITEGYDPVREATYQGKPYQIVTYRRPLGTLPGQAQGSLVVLIDNNQILKLLNGLDIKDGGWVYIADKEGNVISALGDYAKLDNAVLAGGSGSIRAGGKIVTYTRSSQNGWQYVLAQSPNIILEKVNYVKRITLTMTLLFLVTGIVAAAFLTSRSSRKVSRVLVDNLALQQEIEKQAPLLRATFFERLLKGDFVAGGEMESIMKHQQLSSRASSAAAAIIHFAPGKLNDGDDALDELDRRRVMIKEIIRSVREHPVHYHDAAEDKIALLLIEDDLTPEACRDKWRTLLGVIKEESDSALQGSVHMGAGKIYGKLIDVSRSYDEAKQALNFALHRREDAMVWFDEMPHHSDRHYYPEEIETRLMNYAKAGDLHEVTVLIWDIYERNFVRRSLSPSIQRLLIYEMAGTLIKLLERLSLEESHEIKTLLDRADDSDDLGETFLSSKESFAGICRSIHERKRSQNDALLERMISYLRSAYADSDLNLDGAADRMGVSKAYLSHFFKEQTGITFSDFLEDLRMKQARDLLEGSKLTVNDIALRTGYGSTNSFCRAFKRIHGVSATSFRSTNRVTLPK